MIIQYKWLIIEFFQLLIIENLLSIIYYELTLN